MHQMNTLCSNTLNNSWTTLVCIEKFRRLNLKWYGRTCIPCCLSSSCLPQQLDTGQWTQLPYIQADCDLGSVLRPSSCHSWLSAPVRLCCRHCLFPAILRSTCYQRISYVLIELGIIASHASIFLKWELSRETVQICGIGCIWGLG